MANYAAALTLSAGNTRTITITDASDYTGEVGHTAADFYTFYILQVLDVDGEELAVLNDIAGADAGVDKPSEEDPAINTYVVSDDMRYTVNLLAVPNYNSAVDYVYSASNDVYVYIASKIYKLIQSGTDKTPFIETTYWTEQFDIDITDIATMLAALPAEYKTTAYTYSSYDTEALWADMMYRVHTAQNLIGDDATSILNNREWRDAAQLFLDLRSLDGHITNANLEAIDDIFTRAAALLTKYS